MKFPHTCVTKAIKLSWFFFLQLCHVSDNCHANSWSLSWQHYLYELIINLLVHNKCFYQLHQVWWPFLNLILVYAYIWGSKHLLDLLFFQIYSVCDANGITLIWSSRLVLVPTVSCYKWLQTIGKRINCVWIWLYTISSIAYKLSVSHQGFPRWLVHISKPFDLHLKYFIFQACLMLSLESTYPPTYQLALDMLKVQLKLILHRRV